VTLRSNPPRDLPACSIPPVSTPEHGAPGVRPLPRVAEALGADASKSQAPQPQECGGGVRWEIVQRALREEAAAPR
jgi:hypothetical protein